MYISCPSCSTVFIVDEDQIGDHGRKVKCSKCLHIWLQSKFYISSNDIEEPITRGNYHSHDVYLPAIVPKPENKYQWVSPTTLLSIIILLSIILFPNLFNANKNAIALPLSLTKIEAKQNDDQTMTIYSTITNYNSYTTQFSKIRIRLWNPEHKLLKSYIVKKPYIKLLPYESVTIKTEFELINSLGSFDVTTGTDLDFLLE